MVGALLWPCLLATVPAAAVIVIDSLSSGRLQRFLDVLEEFVLSRLQKAHLLVPLHSFLRVQVVHSFLEFFRCFAAHQNVDVARVPGFGKPASAILNRILFPVEG